MVSKSRKNKVEQGTVSNPFISAVLLSIIQRVYGALTKEERKQGKGVKEGNQKDSLLSRSSSFLHPFLLDSSIVYLHSSSNEDEGSEEQQTVSSDICKSSIGLKLKSNF